MTQILVATVALAVISIVLPMHSSLQGNVHAASLEQPRSNDLIYRAQIEIQTCNRKHAETDDAIGVRLNQQNNTWLDYSRNDFERNSTFTYDLMLERVRYIEDISKIELHKRGSHGVILRKFVLRVNGRAIYSKDFGSSCHTLDNDSGYKRSYTVSSNQLRSHSSWQSYDQPPLPPAISRAEIISRIEGIVGNAFRTIDTPVPVKWDGSNAVKVSRRGPQSLSVKVDLKASIKYLPDDSFDVLFDINLQCNNGRIVIESTRPRTDGLTIGDRTLGDRIIVNMNLGASSCPQIQVTNNGDVNLLWPRPTSTPTRRPAPTRTPTRILTRVPTPTTVRLSTPTPTAIATSQSSAVNIGGVVLLRPSDQDVQTISEIDRGVPWADVKTPTNQTNSLTLTAQQPRQFGISWCAANSATLSRNAALLDIDLFINGDSVPSSQINQYDYKSSDWSCRSWSTLITNWPRERSVTLDARYHMIGDVNDGIAVYEAGTYYRRLIVTPQ